VDKLWTVELLSIGPLFMHSKAIPTADVPVSYWGMLEWLMKG